MWRDCRGEGKLGCIVVIAFMVAAILGLYLVGPVYNDKLSFDDEVARIVNRAGVENWKDKAIQDQIRSTASALEFVVEREEIKIKRPGRFGSAPRLVVNVSFQRSVAFPGFTHIFEFHSEYTALIGRL